MTGRPTIGITADLIEHNGLVRAAAPVNYVRAVSEAGGVPVVLPPWASLAVEQVTLCDGLVFTGGDDPVLEPFGGATDPRVTPIHEDRQRAESAMLAYLAQDRPEMPLLGVCLGMQLMALHSGGGLDQHMPATTPTHADHWEHTHAIVGAADGWIPSGTVASKHRQAVSDPGGLAVVARAHDGVIEALEDPRRAFYVGVQWHPERTEHEGLGIELFRRLVRSCL